MFRVVICLTDSAKSNFISQKVEQCFSRKDVFISILSFYSSKQLFRYGKKSLQPDIFIYDPADESGQMLSTAASLKKYYPHMISIVIDNYNSISKQNLKVLDPIHSISIQNARSLFKRLSYAYEQNLKDPYHFSYFCRPTYQMKPINEILYFSSEGRRVHIISNTNKPDIFFYDKLDAVESQLSYKECKFIRAHQSFLVNTNFISSFDRKNIIMKNGDLIGISNYNYYRNLKLFMS